MKVYEMNIYYKDNEIKEEEGKEEMAKKISLNVTEDILLKFNEISRLKDDKEKEKEYNNLLKNIVDYKGNVYNILSDDLYYFTFDNPKEIKYE